MPTPATDQWLQEVIFSTGRAARTLWLIHDRRPARPSANGVLCWREIVKPTFCYI